MNILLEGDAAVFRKSRERVMLENYLEFLRTHRASVHIVQEGIKVSSDKDEFTFAIAGEKGVSLNFFHNYNKIYSLRNGRARNYFSSFGFNRSGSLSFLILKKDPLIRLNKKIIIKSARSESVMEDFCMVQSKIFTNSEEEFDEWYPWLRAANFRNFENPCQHFYLAYENGIPVSTVLVIMTGTTAGIYAVATLPAHRKRGIATALLNHAIGKAILSGGENILLQALKGTRAEAYYLHQGFEPAFHLDIYTKQVS